MAPEQPLRQYPNDDVQPNTTHEVDGDTAQDTYHIPGRPLPEDVSEAPGEPAESPLLEHNEDVVWAAGTDVRSPERAYLTKDNIVLPPEDVNTLPDDVLRDVVNPEVEIDRDVLASRVEPAAAAAELARRDALRPVDDAESEVASPVDPDDEDVPEGPEGEPAPDVEDESQSDDEE